MFWKFVLRFASCLGLLFLSTSSHVALFVDRITAGEAEGRSGLSLKAFYACAVQFLSRSIWLVSQAGRPQKAPTPNLGKSQPNTHTVLVPKHPSVYSQTQHRHTPRYLALIKKNRVFRPLSGITQANCEHPHLLPRVGHSIYFWRMETFGQTRHSHVFNTKFLDCETTRAFFFFE